MKLNKNNHKKKLVIVLSLLLLLFGGGVYAFYIAPQLSNKTQNPQASPNQTQDQTTSQSTTTDLNSKTPTNDPNVDSSKTTNDIPVAKDTSVTITQLSQQNGFVTYSALVTSPGTSGTCSATFTNSLGRPVVDTVTTKDGVCGPASISEAQFTSLGKWTLTLRYYTDNTQASTTKDIEIK